MAKIYKYKNAVLETIQKNVRKINAVIRQNQIRRIKVYIMLFAMCISLFNPLFAIENPNINYGDYNIFCYKDPNIYIKYGSRLQPNYEYYYKYIDESGEHELPVYCLNLGMQGAEDLDGYTVNASEKINDSILHSIVLNCYPYKSCEELGVDNKDEAIFASQFAIWVYLNNLNLNLIGEVNGNQDVVNAINTIYSNGVNNSGKYDVNIDRQIGNQIFEIIDNVYYYTKEIEISNKNNIKDINLSCDDENVKITKLEDKYRISIPVEKVKTNYCVDLKYEIVAKENVALMGISTLEGFQNVAITLKNEFSTSISDKLEFNSSEVEITILKKDKDTRKPLKGVTYNIKTEDNVDIGNYTTDKDGKIKLKIYDSNIKVLYAKEIQTLSDYRLDNNTYKIDIADKNQVEIQFYNEQKKGKIQILKRTKEYNKITDIAENMPLSNVSFYIYDSDMKKVDEIITDKNGLAKTKELPLGKYYIKEIKTQEGYKILDELIEVNIVKDNENVSVEILNENVEIKEKLPVTGM